MVISYKAAQKKPEKVVDQAILARDFMTKKLITFSPGQPLNEVIQILISKGISGGPVLNEKGELIGVISEGDCLKEVVKGKYNNSPQMMGVVEDYMTADPVTVGPNENIFEIAQLFLKLRLRRFPVLDQGKLVGQISQRDVMAAIQDLKNETWH
ncbi:MAG: CBS domain-containing protein [Balneolaceae bacterium]|nr:CBS domain-containing protein [Balneolaceae bacterium]MBO6546690.1 CBS domain-containing protein [Balneolaceae bacterium]MBO6649048.1 CBS domain-containing protein [Balneolaceae bacterium]